MSAADDAYREAQRRIAIARVDRSSRLDLSGSETRALTRLPPEIAKLTGITSLDLAFTQITDLDPIRGMTGITTLKLTGTQINDLDPIRDMTGITALSLARMQITDLDPIRGMTGITTLSLAETQIKDLDPIRGMTRITRLSLAETQTTDLEPIRGMTELVDLHIQGTEVIDLRPLRVLTALGGDNRGPGLVLSGCRATKVDPRIAEIAEIKDDKDRLAQLMAYLEDWEPPTAVRETNIEALLRGPILSESLADVRDAGDHLEADAMGDEPVRAQDATFHALLETLGYAARRLGQGTVENRIGAETTQSLRDYAGLTGKDPFNARLAIFLANGLRAILADPVLTDSLDGFDNTSLTGFLSEHDKLIRDYFPDVTATPRTEVTEDPDVLVKEVFPKLKAARDLIADADEAGLFAPSVGGALGAIERRAEGARKVLTLSTDPAERARAGRSIQEASLLATAYLGRITARTQQWIGKQIAHGRENPADATLKIAGLIEVAQQITAKLKPIFHALWKAIGTLPLPF